MAPDAHGMISASFQPDTGQLAAALIRQAEAMAKAAASKSRNNRDSAAIWRNARLLWPAFTAQGG